MVDIADVIIIIIFILIVAFFGSLLAAGIVNMSTPTMYEIKNITISDKWHETPDNSYHVRYNDNEYVIPEELYKSFNSSSSYTVSIEHKIVYFMWAPFKDPDVNTTKIDRILTYK